ncbi:MAG: biotin/lipoyl-binding protein [Odoribacter sp.]|nr:biotin/lipoyl-binding protein [Odoribacter sp.]
MNKYKITIDGNDFDVTVDVTDHNKAKVEVNGLAYEVTYESKNVTAGAPAPVARKASAPAAPQVQVSAPQATTNSASSIKAPLPGTISSINVKVGDQVKRGDTVVVMEAMKMENNIVASKDGKVKTIHVSAGQTVAQDDKLIDLE